MTDSPGKEFRDFLFRGLMFESEAAQYQKAGIQIGANAYQDEENLLLEALSPFGVSRRNNALEMARLYAVLHCFENEIRDLIRETLEEKEGADWWDKLPQKIRKHAESRQEVATKDSWLEGEKQDLLGFVDFGMLASIIIEKWDCFEIIPSQHWLKQRMEELEKARHFIAHNRVLLPSEFQRVYMYIADWNRVIGL
ncbi:Swt1 family HEPN domain-containing protein [Thioalkalivibrio sp. AKL7]|uniref:Swt1 family HEPN domain-containing protein n=1 Tax=Thioalkalivibrio sp. AKL7 TaxID=1158155 RepID=UPI0018CB4977|nr:Swt1 family HEPN domain-containing protein [Thioalkalivibrio sp. AKL7]